MTTPADFMTIRGHVSTFELDVYFVSRAHDGSEIAEHVASCAQCTAYLDGLAALDGDDSVRLPPRPVLPSAPRRIVRLRGFIAPATAALALAAAVAIYVRSGPSAEDATYVGVKGAPAVQVLVRSSAQTRLWDGRSPVHAGDVIALRVACEQLEHVTVTGEDESGPVRFWEGPCPKAASPLPFTLVWTISQVASASRSSSVGRAWANKPPGCRAGENPHQRSLGDRDRASKGTAVMSALVRLYWLVAIVVAVVAPRIASASDPPRTTRRLAVVVGANDPAPGRQALRYAQSDAQLMADVLVRVGRFAKADVQVLLEPRPGEVLAALDEAARELQNAGPDSLLLFYYSGHSDGQQVFPHGETLSLVDLRDRIARSTARVRVAILDTCRGGAWTRTKGLTVGPPLDSVDLMNVATEGTALLSSSSGLENAHEAGSVKGSFFTHHVAAGLLGAADKSGDGTPCVSRVLPRMASMPHGVAHADEKERGAMGRAGFGLGGERADGGCVRERARRRGVDAAVVEDGAREASA